MRGHPSSTVSAWPEIVDWIVQRPMVESNMTAKKFNEMISKDILLYFIIREAALGNRQEQVQRPSQALCGDGV